MEIQQKVNMRGTMRTMEPGDSFTLPIRQYTQSAVRACASNVGLDEGKVIKVQLNRKEGYFKIIRIA